MIHHSISHAAVSVLSVMSAEYLSHGIRHAWPVLNRLIRNAAVWLADNFPTGLSPEVWNSAVVALVLGLVWGGAFWIITIRPERQGLQR